PPPLLRQPALPTCFQRYGIGGPASGPRLVASSIPMASPAFQRRRLRHGPAPERFPAMQVCQSMDAASIPTGPPAPLPPGRSTQTMESVSIQTARSGSLPFPGADRPAFLGPKFPDSTTDELRERVWAGLGERMKLQLSSAWRSHCTTGALKSNLAS